MSRTLRWFGFFLVLALVAPGVARSQGTIRGRVTDASTRQPLTDVQVRVMGTTRGAVSGADGSYSIGGMAAGSVSVRAQRIGYNPSTQVVTVTAGGTVTADFALTPAATALEQVVVTATGETQRKRETPHTVSTVRVDSMDKATISNFSQLLSSRAPSVVVQEAGGTTGTGSRVRIRGNNSVSLSNDPLIIIDGVRVSNASSGIGATSLGVGGQQPSRFNDLNPEDIESIEILKGPSGVSLYGTAGANGVIQVTTKRGKAGRTQWTSFIEGAQLTQNYDWPANYAAPGKNLPSGTPTSNCTLYNKAQGFCSQDSIISFNPLKVASPFRTGNRLQYGLSAAGGNQSATYYVAGESEDEQGVYDVSQLRRSNARANLTGQLRSNLSVTVNSGYQSSDLRLPQNDNNLLGAISAGLLGAARDNPVSRGYASGQTPQAIFNGLNTRQQIERFTGGARASWTPISWLSATGQFGADIINRHDNEMIPPNVVNIGSLPEGQRSSNRFQQREYTATANASATYNPMADLGLVTQLGVQYNDQRLNGTRAFGARVLAGTESLSGTNARFAVSEENQEVVTIGYYGQEQFSWRDRLFANVALRADDNSAFGTKFGYTYYPAAGVSWVVSEEPFFPTIPMVGQIRLRGSYGESGQRPGFRQAQQFFSAVSVNVKGVETPGFTYGGVGNANLEPEKSKEFEFGADFNNLFNNRASIELTYYDKTTDKAIIFVRTAPSLGVSTTQPRNLGQVKNSGLELQLTATPVNTDMVAWDFTLSGSTNQNKLIRLGFNPADTNPIIFGLGGASQRHAQGYPLGAYFMRKYTYADANGDGLIGPSEVKLDAQPTFFGTNQPKREVSVNTSLTLSRIVRIGANLDHRGGQKLNNSTRRFRCASAFVNCRDAFDISASNLYEQARIAASRLGTDAGYIEDASFTKLREVSISLIAPKSLLVPVRLGGATLTFSGRNLATWTKYTGFDPEINFTADGFSTADFLSQPPVKYYTARLTLTF